MGISVKQAKNISSVLSEGLPYIQKFKGKTIVVKYGGAAMSDHGLKRNFTRDIALLSLVGMTPVIVHGGGPQIGKELKKSGIISNFNSGLRVTDKPTMTVVKEILGKQKVYEDYIYSKRAGKCQKKQTPVNVNTNFIFEYSIYICLYDLIYEEL